MKDKIGDLQRLLHVKDAINEIQILLKTLPLITL